MSQLAGIAEIAELLGVTRQRVTQLTKREDFPPPVERLRMGPVWNLSDVKDWIGRRK